MFLSVLRKYLSPSGTPISLYNSLSKQKEVFVLPPGVREVRMYNCGPTVYDTSHIGNLRSYIFADLVRRALQYNGFRVKQVINITDFGHLSSDADAGADKMSTALKRAGLKLTLENMHELAEKYTAQFLADLQLLNIDTSRIQFPRASGHIPGEIALIKTLEEKGYAYRGKNGVYFDTSRFPDYGKLGGINLDGQKEGARVATDTDKHSATDFLLWKSDAKIGWDSPWGKGFPGWHIECSAMINATLGKQIDIHTGGIDLMPTHHNNEIAQSESATGRKPFSRFWLHHEFLNLEEAKISKSAGNMINLSTLLEKGFHPLSYRYFLLGAHYRKSLNFTWEALQAAEQAYLHMTYLLQKSGTGEGRIVPSYQSRFTERINDDLDTAGGLAILWEAFKDTRISEGDRRATALDIDRVLGLNLAHPSEKVLRDAYLQYGAKEVVRDAPAHVRELTEQREKARLEKDFTRADELRSKIRDAGFDIIDTPNGPKIIRS
jgi:cysteinyl-tRNA synthetase